MRPYITFKDELSPADGIVYKEQQAVIPKSMRPAMLDKIHKTRFGEGLCIGRAKSILPMMPWLLQLAVAYSGTVKTAEIEGAVLEQNRNLEGMPHDAIQPGQ